MSHSAHHWGFGADYARCFKFTAAGVRKPPRDNPQAASRYHPTLAQAAAVLEGKRVTIKVMNIYSPWNWNGTMKTKPTQRMAALVQGGSKIHKFTRSKVVNTRGHRGTLSGTPTAMRAVV